jgi:hypothetical protein
MQGQQEQGRSLARAPPPPPPLLKCRRRCPPPPAEPQSSAEQRATMSKISSDVIREGIQSECWFGL